MGGLKKYTGISDSRVPDFGNCRLELSTHMLIKGMQIGSVAGLTFYPARSAIHFVQPNFPLERRPPSHYITAGLVLGAVIGPAVYYAQTRRWTEAECCARVFKLRRSNATFWMDRMCFVGAACGAGAAYFLGNNLFNGAAFGFASGSLLGCVASVTM